MRHALFPLLIVLLCAAIDPPAKPRVVSRPARTSMLPAAVSPAEPNVTITVESGPGTAPVRVVQSGDAETLKTVLAFVTTMMITILPFMQWYLAYKQGIRDKVVKETLERSEASRRASTQALGKQTDAIAVVVDKVHTLTNGAMEISLQQFAVVTERMAELTKDPKDVEAAKQASEALALHRAAKADLPKTQASPSPVAPAVG